MPFQEIAVTKALGFLKQTGSVYFAHEMGLGKSVQAIETCNRLGSEKVLVICPAVVCLVWEAELKKWSPKARFTVLSYNTATTTASYLKTLQFDTLILDEVHFCKNHKAQRSKAVLNTLWPKAKYHMLLSGTPMTKSVTDLWFPFSKILPDEFGDFHEFAYRYSNATQTPWGIRFDGIKRADELSKIIRAKFFIRSTKAEVLTELPPKTWQKIPLGREYAVQLTDEEKIANQEYFKLLKESFAKGGRAPGPPPKAVATWRREQGLKKVKPVVAFAKELLDQDIPIVIFTAHKDVLHEIKEALKKYSPAVIEGGSSSGQRREAIEDFQEGRTNLFIGNIAAAGVGITLTRSSTVLFAELDWSPATVAQSSNRVHRIGSKEAVTIYYFTVLGSIDEDILNSVVSKVSDFEQVLKA